MNGDANRGDGARRTTVDTSSGPSGLGETQRAVWTRLGGTARPIGEVIAAYVAECGGTAADHLADAAALLELVAPEADDPGPEPVQPEPPSPFLDLALHRYEPAAPMVDPLAGIDLFWATFDDENERETWRQLVGELQAAVDGHPIVWAVKYPLDGPPGRELYFLAHGTTLTTMFDAVRGVIEQFGTWRAPTVLPARAIDFSIEPVFDSAGRLRPVERIDVRTMFDGGAADIIVAFDATQDDLELKNVYRTYDYPGEWTAIRTRLAESRFATPEAPDVFCDELPLGYGLVRGCRSVWLAEKRDRDGVYLTGLYLDAFVEFLDGFGLPDRVRSFVRSNERRLRHLRFDVGMDYRVHRDGFDVVGAGFFGTIAT